MGVFDRNKIPIIFNDGASDFTLYGLETIESRKIYSPIDDTYTTETIRVFYLEYSDFSNIEVGYTIKSINNVSYSDNPFIVKDVYLIVPAALSYKFVKIEVENTNPINSEGF